MHRTHDSGNGPVFSGQPHFKGTVRSRGKRFRNIRPRPLPECAYLFFLKISKKDKYLTKSFQIVFCDNKNDSVNKYQEKFITYSEPIPLSIFSTSSTRLSNEVYAEKGSHKYLIKRQRISTGLSSGDNVYVVDRESKSVQKLGSNGESEEWKGTVFQSPYGSVYVTDQADQTAPLDNCVWKFTRNGKDVFLMNETEILSASQLNTWLDIVQETISGKVILIYDACNSGSFLSSLTFPGQGGRILITSAHPGQQAHFLNQGMISFSDYFWTHTFNGRDIHDSFYLTKEAIHEAVGTQTPLLSGNVPVSGVYIGNGTQIHWQNPVIKTAFYNPETNLLRAEAEDEDGIARVWAVIIPRDYNQKLSDNPVIDLPPVDLMPVADNPGRYEATRHPGCPALFGRERRKRNLPYQRYRNIVSPGLG